MKLSNSKKAKMKMKPARKNPPFRCSFLLRSVMEVPLFSSPFQLVSASQDLFSLIFPTNQDHQNYFERTLQTLADKLRFAFLFLFLFLFFSFFFPHFWQGLRTHVCPRAPTCTHVRHS